jgi:hypothetical protein
MRKNNFSLTQMGIVIYCAEECVRQQSGEASVAWMLNAYRRLADHRGDGCDRPLITAELVQELYSLVEPVKNKSGFRQTNVVVGGKAIGWENIPRQMDSLLSAQRELTPIEFYREFEEIHAGADGNGRVGSLLFNYLRDSLEGPVAPPDIFNAHN